MAGHPENKVLFCLRCEAKGVLSEPSEPKGRFIGSTRLPLRVRLAHGKPQPNSKNTIKSEVNGVSLCVHPPLFR
jgi:hypothetical protein